MNYLSEAFKELDFLNEDNFSLDSTSDIDDMSHFLSLERDPVQDVIDPEAENEEELEDTYIGKVILHCPVCNSMIYKDLEDIEKSDDEELVNVGEECPYCCVSDGFKVIGIVSPFQEEESKEDTEIEASDETGDQEVEIEEDSVEENLQESVGQDVSEYQKWVDFDMEKYHKISDNTMQKIKEAGLSVVKDQYGEYEVIADRKDECLGEDFEHVEVSTDEQKLVMDAEEDGKITIESEPVANEAEGEEFIQPVPEVVEDEIEDSAEVEVEAPEEEEIDYDIEDFDEESFDGLGEAYLKEVYDNVDSYKTSNVSMKGNSLVVEGVIKFTSGKEKKTNFIFEAKTATKNNKLRFIGENKQITRGRKAFTITGQLNENKSFITEKFNYNYMTKNAKGNSTRLYGTLKK